MSNEELEIKELELEARIASLKLEVKKLEVSYRKNYFILGAIIKELFKRGILNDNDLRELAEVRRQSTYYRNG
jgi:hypothetical protein